jgi:hypothetical protein
MIQLAQKLYLLYQPAGWLTTAPARKEKDEGTPSLAVGKRIALALTRLPLFSAEKKQR